MSPSTHGIGAFVVSDLADDLELKLLAIKPAERTDANAKLLHSLSLQQKHKLTLCVMSLVCRHSRTNFQAHFNVPTIKFDWMTIHTTAIARKCPAGCVGHYAADKNAEILAHPFGFDGVMRVRRESKQPARSCLLARAAATLDDALLPLDERFICGELAVVLHSLTESSFVQPLRRPALATPSLALR